MRAITFFVLGVACASALAQSNRNLPTEILSLQLGQPITLPQCATSRFGNYGSIIMMEGKPCWMHSWRGPKPGRPLLPLHEEVNLALPSDRLPKGIKLEGITAVVVDGRIEALTMLTTGQESQNELLLLLTDKYGEPDKKTIIPVQNRLGASFDSIMADWKSPNLDVQFVGMAHRIDRGLVQVSTPIGSARQKQLKSAEDAAAPKF